MDGIKRYYLDLIVSNDIIKAMKYDLTPCQITSGIVNTLAAIAESIGQLEGVNLIQPGPQLRRKNRIQTIQAFLANPPIDALSSGIRVPAGGASYPRTPARVLPRARQG